MLKMIHEFEKVERRKPIDGTYIVLVGLFVGCLVSANFIAIKLCNIFGLVVPAGVIAYSITFTVTDIISDVYGRKAASYAVWAGFAANIVMVAMVFGGWLLPPLSPAFQSKYQVLLSTPRIVAASMVAYLLSQNHDVLAFHFWKALTKGRHLWLRNNASTAVSQLIDTCTFITLAFYGVVPNSVLLNMILGQYLIKLLIAICDTPFVYLGVKLISGRNVSFKEIALRSPSVTS